MQLVDCGALSDIAFREYVMRLQLLEELEISFNNNLSPYSVEVVGRCCRLLKWLKYTGVVIDNKGNDVSFAIAKSMTGLHHLKIYDDGVLSILDSRVFSPKWLLLFWYAVISLCRNLCTLIDLFLWIDHLTRFNLFVVFSWLMNYGYPTTILHLYIF